MADVEVELLAAGLDLSWAVAGPGRATPRARVTHVHARTCAHNNKRAHISHRKLQSHPNTYPNPNRPLSLLKFPGPLLSFPVSGELRVVKYGVETCYMLA